MSYDTERVKLGREPITMCGLVMDTCSLTYGSAPCTASVGVTGTQKCFNTRATCQDTANYTKTTKEYLFSQPSSNLPKGVNIFPVIDGQIQKAGTSTTAGSGLGKRAVITVNFKDFPHSDRQSVDPYFSERTYNAIDQGTFWGKFITRNPFYEGRTLKVYYGYIGDTFSFSDFEVQEYDIIDIEGPSNGMVKLTAKDVLVRTYDRKSQYPAANTGELLSDISSGATSATLTPTGIGDSEYPASGTLSIGKEAFTFTRSGDSLTLAADSIWGTEQKDHKTGDSVQVCAAWNTSNIIDVLDELLVTGAGLPSAFIPTTDWETERDLWLTNANVKGILMKPESIEKVLGELSESFMFDIWWDAVAQEVKMKALSPEAAGVTLPELTETSNIIKDSLKVERKSKERFTEIRVFYKKIDYSDKNEIENFAGLQISADVDRASSDQYNGNSIKTIMTRWFDDQSMAIQLSGRQLSRFSDTPDTITFKLDQKDIGLIDMAERFSLDSWQFQDFSGANEMRNYQVLEVNEGRDVGHDFTVKALTSSFVGRYFFVTIDAMVDYSAATDAQKAANGFISQADGTFPDGTLAYKII